MLIDHTGDYAGFLCLFWPSYPLVADFLVKLGLILELTKHLMCQTVVRELGKEPLVVPELHAVAKVSTSDSCDGGVVYKDPMFKDISQPIVWQTKVAFATHNHDCVCMDT